jgi:site-specific DNA-adenine methylase
MPKIPQILPHIGSQWNSAPWICQKVPGLNDAKEFADVFGGSASVLLHKSKSLIEYYNDLNPLTSLFFKTLRDYPSTLTDQIKLLLSYESHHAFYANQISDFFNLHDSQKILTWQEEINYSAVYWIYAHSSYRGAGDRWNSSRSPTKWNRIKSFPFAYQQSLLTTANRLYLPPQVSITNLDAFSYIKTLADQSSDIFFYLDPPFPNSVRLGKDSRHHSPHAKSRLQYRYDLPDEPQHGKLLELITSLPNPFAICSYQNPFYDAVLLTSDCSRKVEVIKKPVRDMARQNRTLCIYYSVNR